MKVAMFLSSHNIGLSTLLTEQAIHFSKLHDLEFVFLTGENEQEKGLKKKLIDCHLAYTIINGLDYHQDFWKLVNKFWSFVATNQPDIVHVQTNWQLIISALVKLRSTKKFKIIYTIHGYRHNKKYISYIALLVIQFLLSIFADHVFAASTAVYKKFNFIQKKTSILPLGVDESFFSSDIQTCVASTPLTIIFPGQFRVGKNQHLIINAVSQYIAKTKDSTIQVYLPGEGPLKSSYQSLTSQLDLSSNIHFPGQMSRDEILSLYKKSNIAIIPSNSETFGHAIAEPFVLGLCVISRRTGIAEDIIIPSDNGFLFDSDQQIADILIELYESQNTICQTGLNTFKTRDFLRWQNIANLYSETISKLYKENTL